MEVTEIDERQVKMKSEVSADHDSSSDDSSSASRSTKSTASLRNLGNTCYVNSVLQVLYRTPGFAELVSNLAIEIALVNQAKASPKEDSSNNEQTGFVSDVHCWTLVMSLNQLFIQMRLVERDGKTVDTALRPVDLLKDIRLLNPMFSDNLQHDAHELLRCLLSYVDDATSYLSHCRRDILQSSAVHLENNRVACIDFAVNKSISSLSCDASPSLKLCSLPGEACNNNNKPQPFPTDHTYAYSADGNKQEESGKNGFLKGMWKHTLRSGRTFVCKDRVPNGGLLKLSRSFSCPEVKVSVKRINFSHLFLSRSLNGLSHLSLNRFSQRCLNRLSRSSIDEKDTNMHVAVPMTELSNWSLPASTLLTSPRLNTMPWSPRSDCCPDSVVSNEIINNKEMDIDADAAVAKLSAINQLEAFDRGRSCRVEIPYQNRSARWRQSASNRSTGCLVEGSCQMHRYTEPPAICIRDMFGGEMSMRTRCLSCCRVASRSEIYEDIALPISQSTPQGSSGFDWIFSALDEVEKLQGENRYQCNLCDQLADVERSVHYITAPRILTLHLKRFASQSSHVTKTIDNVSVPLVLPCIERDCRQSCDSSPNHWYELYGVVAHSGRLASSGHYISYVRDREADHSSVAGDTVTAHSPTSAAVKTAATVRVSMRSKLSHRYPGCIGKASASVNQRLAVHLAAISTANRSLRRRWLECDDDSVSVLTEVQFEAKLKNAGKMTPYLLFYEKRLCRQPVDCFESLSADVLSGSS